MPRPSELLQRMIKELAAGGRQDALRELGRWLDQLNAQIDPTTLRIETTDVGGGAPDDAPYLTVGAATGLSAYRQIDHDATLAHTDGGALADYTLSVVDNGHRHIEENIDETKYLVVDANGNGDFTSLTAALGHITTNGTDDDRWTVMVRSDLTEDINNWSAGPSKSNIHVHVWSLGRTRINGWVQCGAYGTLHLHNFRIYNTDNFTNATLRASNGNSIYAYDCELMREEAIPVGPQGIVIDPSGGTVYLYRCKIQQLTAAEYPAIRFVNAGYVYAWDCEIIANASAGRGGVTCNIGGSLFLYHCKLSNIGTDNVIEIAASDGDISVWRCQYDTTRVGGTGTVTILDGDVPYPLLDLRYLKLAADNDPLTSDLKTAGRKQATAVKTGNYTLTNTDEVVVFTATATATLPAATGSGQSYRICNESASGTVTVDANGSETIKGATTQTLYPGDDLIVTDYKSGGWV